MRVHRRASGISPLVAPPSHEHAITPVDKCNGFVGLPDTVRVAYGIVGGMERVIIRFLTGAKRGQTEIYPVARFDGLSLGRDPACDVRFDPQRDDLVSRHHCGIEWDHSSPRIYVLTDLLSSNGTFLNGKRVQEPMQLNDGDVIEFGRNGPSICVGFEVVDPAAHHPSRVTQNIPRIP